jgi:hypothetical protein
MRPAAKPPESKGMARLAARVSENFRKLTYHGRTLAHDPHRAGKPRNCPAKNFLHRFLKRLFPFFAGRIWHRACPGRRGT